MINLNTFRPVAIGLRLGNDDKAAKEPEKNPDLDFFKLANLVKTEWHPAENAIQTAIEKALEENPRKLSKETP